MPVRNMDTFKVNAILTGLIRNRGSKASMKTKMKLRRMVRAIDERRQDVQEEITLLHDEYAVKNDDGEYVFEDEQKTKLKIQESRREEFDERYEELIELEWEDAPTIRASLIEEEFPELDFETVWALGDFLEDDLPDDAADVAKEKAEAKRDRKRRKRIADASENGTGEPVAEMEG